MSAKSFSLSSRRHNKRITSASSLNDDDDLTQEYTVNEDLYDANTDDQLIQNDQEKAIDDGETTNDEKNDFSENESDHAKNEEDSNDEVENFFQAPKSKATGSTQKPKKSVKKHQPFQIVKHNFLYESVMKEKQIIKDVQNRSFQKMPKNNEPVSFLYTQYAGKSGKVKLLINLTEMEFMDLYFTFEKFALKERKRGPLPSIPWIDALFLQLLFYSCKDDVDKLGALVDVKGPTLRKSIERTRPILYDALHERWWTNRPRPKPLDKTSFEHAALLIDSTSFQVFRPKGHFKEAMHYWDGKNGLYALKKEIAVLASPPHYALFSQKAHVGSVHDYTMFKENHFNYVSYLQKTLAEKSILINDRDEKKWSIIADMGYIGPHSDTPLIRKITPPKGKNLSYIEKLQKKEINKLRVPVECFFGRMQKLWKITRTVYSMNHKNFDEDIDICVLLTNEHIKSFQLDEEDSRFYFALEDQKRVEKESKTKKKRIQLKEYHERKRRRLEQSDYDNLYI